MRAYFHDNAMGLHPAAWRPHRSPGYAPGFLGTYDRLSEIDPEDPSGRRAVVHSPTRMDTGVAADQCSIVHCEPVRIARTRHERRRFQHASGRGFILDQARVVIRVSFGVVADHLPDG